MNDVLKEIDHQAWDWLPGSAKEIADYLERLLTEAAITAHDVTARTKSIASFNEKCELKGYADPAREVTDTVAVRIITYSVTDKDRITELIRDRFTASEDRNPGEGRPPERRGYDCHHFVVTGESPDADYTWMISGGKLERYFVEFGGLEIQIRTVAAHAWAEFEHARRYKGQPYKAISTQDQETIDQLFAAAADARSALDATFVAIDALLANPSSSRSHTEEALSSLLEKYNDQTKTEVTSETLRPELEQRFPDDEPASKRGMEFACELLSAMGIESIEELSQVLRPINSEQVRLLMDTSVSVTHVRRLDDELLARYGEDYITQTADVGVVQKRRQQLEWRYDRLRHKVGTRAE